MKQSPMNLTSENIEKTILKLLFKDGEDTTTAVIAKGVMCHLGFHPERLKEEEDNISSMLEQLPDSFMESGGGGMSFLNACLDRNGRQWGEHQSIDKLICLGMAIGRVVFPLPRDMWSSLPGGMPYFTVTTGSEVAQ